MIISRIEFVKAAASAKIATHTSGFEPGFIMNKTPAKPINTAVQRRQPTFSPSRNGAIAVPIIGEIKKIAITSASSTNEDWRLSDSFLFVTKEPCPMCAGAILNSRLKGIIYGFYDKEWGACGSYYDICRDKKINKFPIIKGGVLENDCRYLINEFFNKVRNR